MAIFDTHAAVEALIGKGVQKDQAEIFVRLIQDSKDSELGNLASKEQVTLLEKDVANIIQNVATKTDLERAKSEMLKWYIATTVILAGLLTGGFSTLLKLIKP